MRFSILIALAAATMPVAACGPSVTIARPAADPPPASENAALVDAVVLQGNKALTLAALGYDSIARSATAAIRVGAVPRTALPRLKELNAEAREKLSFGYTATTAAEKARAAVALNNTVERIRQLVAP